MSKSRNLQRKPESIRELNGVFIERYFPERVDYVDGVLRFVNGTTPAWPETAVPIKKWGQWTAGQWLEAHARLWGAYFDDLRSGQLRLPEHGDTKFYVRLAQLKTGN